MITVQRLQLWRRFARAVLWTETVLPALYPVVALLLGFIALALLGGLRWLPPWLHLLLLVALAGGSAALLWHGLSGLQPPAPEAVDRRLERDSGLRHRPLAALGDHPAAADPEALRLWQAHLTRAAAQLGALRLRPPRLRLAAHDPHHLRFGLLLALAAGLALAGTDTPARLAGAFRPDLPAGGADAAPMLQAWITPPDYAGTAPIFLDGSGGALAVPAGSVLTVDLSGGSGRPSLVIGDRRVAFSALDRASWQVQQPLREPGRVAVRRWGALVAAWDISVTANPPPIAEWRAPPGPTRRGRLRLPWHVAQQYGVTDLRAELRLVARPAAPPLIVPIPLPGRPRAADGTATPDLTADPWAGLPVAARLVARDAAGQQASSTVALFTLPEHPFRNPLARALAAIRQRLSRDPDQRVAAERDLDALAAVPQTFDGDAGVFLNLRTIQFLLADNPDPLAVAEAQQRLWTLALALDDDPTGQTARRLEDAQQALQDLLGAAARDPQSLRDPAAAAALGRDLDALQHAIERHLQAMAQQARRDRSFVPFDPNARHLSSDDFRQLIQQMRDAARAGRVDALAEEMAQLDHMLSELQQARPETAEAMRRNAERAERGREQMAVLQDLLRRQANLLDRAQQRLGTPTPTPPNLPFGLNQGETDASDLAAPGGGMTDPSILSQLPQLGSLPGAPPPPAQASPAQAAEAARDAGVQRALQRALGELLRQFGSLPSHVPPGLGAADAAMSAAGAALVTAHDAEAASAQQRAVAALQQSARAMSEAAARQFSLSPGGGGAGSGTEMQGQDSDAADQPDGSGRDPLGRAAGANGLAGDDPTLLVPEQSAASRSRHIEDELRRRAAERHRPPLELDYIERLLQPF